MRLKNQLIEAQKTYKVAGWAPVSEEAMKLGGEPIWDVLTSYLKDIKTVKARSLNMPIIKGIKNNPGIS